MKNLLNGNLECIFDELLNGAIRENKEIALESIGDCMQPLLKEGDKISFKKVDINKLRLPDLIVFKEKNNYISHRFIKTVRKNDRTYIISRSDVFRKYDYPIAEEDFIGLITKIGKVNKTIYLDTFKGRLKSYLNIFIAPLFLLKRKKEYFRNENEFLTSISGVNIDKHSITRVKELLSKDLNWDYISAKIKWNFIAPFISKNIIKNDGLKDLVPKKIREEVRQTCAWQLHHDTKIYSELKNVLNTFNSNNIKAIVLKGAHLGEEVYGTTFLRWMGDIDILAKIGDWPKIKDILQKLGFKFREADYDDWGLRYLDNHITFFKSGVKLELKFNVWHIDFPFFKDDLWQRARGIILAGEEALVPSIEDTLLIACASLTRHSYVRLIWLCDIREIIDKFRETINWNAVIKKTKEKDIDCIVYYALYYSSRLLNYEISEDILKRLKPSFIKRKLHNFFWNEKIILWKKEGHPVRAKIPFEIAILLFAGKISFKLKKLLKMLLYISNVIIPSKTHLSRRCGINKDSPKLIFYYLLQPFRFILLVLSSLKSLLLRRT